MVATYEIYLREKNVTENCQADSNRRKRQTQVCENFQGFPVCLRNINTHKKGWRVRELILLIGLIPNEILLKLVIFRHEPSPLADNVTKRVFV